MQKLQLSPAALWASAFAIAALIIVQGSRLGVGNEARADLVASTGALTALTVEAANEDILCVIDGRSENDVILAAKLDRLYG